jgi:hypothetical protein
MHGTEHPDTATCLNNLAILVEEQGDLSGSRKFKEQALAIRKKVLGPEHPDTAASLNNLAFLLWIQGDLAGLVVCLQVDHLNRLAASAPLVRNHPIMHHPTSVEWMRRPATSASGLLRCRLTISLFKAAI